jgi:hypothetical protein
LRDGKDDHPTLLRNFAPLKEAVRPHRRDADIVGAHSSATRFILSGPLSSASRRRAFGERRQRPVDRALPVAPRFGYSVSRGPGALVEPSLQ